MDTLGADTICYLKSANTPVVKTIDAKDAFVIDPSHRSCADNTTSAVQRAVHVFPTRTVFELLVGRQVAPPVLVSTICVVVCPIVVWWTLNARIHAVAALLKQVESLPVNLTFLSTMFTDDYVRLSRPAYYIDVSLGLSASDASGAANVNVYVAFSAEHAVNKNAQEVVWGEDDVTGAVHIGNAEQNVLVRRTISLVSFAVSQQRCFYCRHDLSVLFVDVVFCCRVQGSKGDRVNIDWGFLHMAPQLGSAAWAGSLAASVAAFATTGSVPSMPDTRMPRAVSDDLPGLVVVANVTLGEHHTFVVGYDDIRCVCRTHRTVL